MLAVAVAEHVDVVHRDPAARGRDVGGRAVQGAMVGSAASGARIAAGSPWRIATSIPAATESAAAQNRTLCARSHLRQLQDLSRADSAICRSFMTQVSTAMVTSHSGCSGVPGGAELT